MIYEINTQNISQLKTVDINKKKTPLENIIFNKNIQVNGLITCSLPLLYTLKNHLFSLCIFSKAVPVAKYFFRYY